MGYYNTGFYASRTLQDARYDNDRGREAGFSAGLGDWRDAQQALAWSNSTEKQKENPSFVRGFDAGFKDGRAERDRCIALKAAKGEG